jgi:hypothetical protein
MNSANAAAAPALNTYPLRTPRFWHGMRTGLWWSLLARNGFRVAPSRLHLALGVSFFTPFNDLLGLIQQVTYGGQIDKTVLEHDPVFILGHWRSGTTLMHELLVLDERFASPSTYACFAPWHFLLSEKLMIKFGSALLPDKRPMDNMRAGWELPQEDEFALMNLGAPTPYLRIAFPKSDPPWMNFFDMRDIAPEDLERWRRKLTWFVKALTLHHQGRQLVLKSPPHTGRVHELLALYPNAKFVHMVRDPRKLFMSTLRLWKSLEDIQGMQREENDERLKQYLWECLTRMYEGFEAARSEIPKGRIIDVKYEELVADPVATVGRVYTQLGLGDYSQLGPKIAARFAADSEYKVNEHRINPELEAAVLANWGPYAKRYGYV